MPSQIEAMEELKRRGYTVKNLGGKIAVSAPEANVGTGIVQPSPEEQKRGATEKMLGLQPSAQMQQALVDGFSTLRRLERIKSEYNPNYVGPIQAPIGTALGKTGLIAPKHARFRIEVTNLQNLMVKFLTGAQLSQQEAERIIKGLPSLNMSDPEFKAAMVVAERETLDKIKVINDTLRGLGVRTPAAPVRRATVGTEMPKPSDLQGLSTQELLEQLKGRSGIVGE